MGRLYRLGHINLHSGSLSAPLTYQQYIHFVAARSTVQLPDQSRPAAVDFIASVNANRSGLHNLLNDDIAFGSTGPPAVEPPVNPSTSTLRSYRKSLEAFPNRGEAPCDFGSLMRSEALAGEWLLRARVRCFCRCISAWLVSCAKSEAPS